MTIARDGYLDLDEIKMYYELIARGASDMDMVMLVERSGTALPCETARDFPDRKPRMNIEGYFLAGRKPQAEQRVLRMGSLYVARRSDMTTASLASLLSSNDMKLRVEIQIYRASGDKKMADRDPSFVLEIEEARLTDLVLNTGGVWPGPSELMSFEYRSLLFRSAPQMSTGQIGARNEWRLNLGSQS